MPLLVYNISGGNSKIKDAVPLQLFWVWIYN